MHHVKKAEVKPTHLCSKPRLLCSLEKKDEKEELALISSPQSHKQAAQLHNTDMQQSDWIVLHLGWWEGGSADRVVGHSEQPMSRQCVKEFSHTAEVTR